MEKYKLLALTYKVPLIIIALGIVCLIVGSLFPVSSLFQTPKSSSESVIVDIEGEVAAPGLYKLKGGLPVGEVIKMAGGLTVEADSTFINEKINLAQPVKDGQKILIPSKNRPQTGSSQNDSTLDLNTASQPQLEALPGIGPVTAQKIISGRPFGSVDEVVSRKILSKSVFAKVKDAIAVN